MPFVSQLRRLVFTLLGALATIVGAQAQCAPQWQVGEPTSSFYGAALASTTWDPDGTGPAAPLLVVAGSGLVAGQVWDGGIAAWNGTQWLALGTPPDTEACAVASWNGLLVAVFRRSGATTMHIATYNGVAWTTIGTTGGNNSVSASGCLAVHQGNLYFGGNFTQIDGAPFQYVAQWTGSGWASLGSGPQYYVAQMVSFQGVLYMVTNRITAPIQGQVETWNGSVWTVVATSTSYLNSIAVRNGTALTNTFLYVGGHPAQFTGVNGTIAGPLVRFSPSTNAWTSLGFPTTTVVNDIKVRSTGISSFEAAVVDSANLWLQVGGVWTPQGNSLLGATSATYFSGAWHVTTVSLNNSMTQRLQAGTWVPLTQTVTGIGAVLTVRDAGSAMVIGGSFGLAQGQPGSWTAVGGLAGSVERIARLANGDLVVCGTFSTPNLGLATRIARWDGVTWTSLASSYSGQIRAIQPLPNGDLVFGGTFTSIHGVALSYIARWNGSAWLPLGGGVNNFVSALAVLPNGDLLAGGDFTLAGTLTNIAMYVAKWNGSAWTAMSAQQTVRSLVVEGNGGVVALMTNLGAARWNGVAWPMLHASAASSMIGLPGGDLFFAGSVVNSGTTTVEQTDANGVRRSIFTCGGAVDEVWCAADGDVLLAGNFLGVSPVASVGIARRHAPCPATATSYGTSCTGPAGPMVLQATELPWVLGTYRARTTGFGAGMVGISALGLVPTSTPLASILPGSGACDLLVNAVTTSLLVPTGGVTTHQFAMPSSPVFVGVVILDQVLALVTAGPSPTLQASNGLQLQIGVDF